MRAHESLFEDGGEAILDELTARSLVKGCVSAPYAFLINQPAISGSSK